MKENGLGLEKDWYLKLGLDEDHKIKTHEALAELQHKSRYEYLQKVQPSRRKRPALIPHDTSERLTVSQVAKELGFEPCSVYEWVRMGLIAAERHGPTGKAIRITRAALEEYRMRNYLKHG